MGTVNSANGGVIHLAGKNIGKEHCLTKTKN